MNLLRSVLIFCFAIVSAEACGSSSPESSPTTPPPPPPPATASPLTMLKVMVVLQLLLKSLQQHGKTTVASTVALPKVIAVTDASIPPVALPNVDEKAVQFAVTLVDTDSNQTARCSGSIVSPHFAVTCCLHCLLNDKKEQKTADDLLVKYGDFKNYFIAFHVLKIKSLHIHDGCYNNTKYDSVYDIGLVQTVDKFIYGPDVRPAKITRETVFYKPFSIQTMLLSSLRSKDFSATTKEESVWFGKVKYNDKCRDLLDMYYKDQNLCTNYNHSMGERNCLTDYGSSLSFEDEIGGILIYKVDCGAGGSVAGYVSISHNSKWLRTTVSKATNYKERIN